MLHKRKIITGILTFLSFTLVSMVAISQSGNSKAVEILESLQKQYEESVKGIEDYVLIKGDRTIYHKKAYDNGRPYFKIKTKDTERMESATARNTDLYSQLSEEVKEKATYEGKDEVDGHDVHIIYADEVEVENLDNDPHTENTIEDLYLYIDPDKWVIRQMEYTVEFTDDNGKVREVSPIIHNKDFREVEGMMIPYETSTVVKGLTLTEEERKEAKEGLKKFNNELNEMPEAQRKMAKQMMGDQIEEYKQMLKKDKYERVRKVKEVKVNTGMEDFD